MQDTKHKKDENLINTLYYHRTLLFSIICNNNLEKAWKSEYHDDYTRYEGYFIAGITTKEGDFTYHIPKEYGHLYKDVKELEVGRIFDGHTSKDITRLLTLIK